MYLKTKIIRILLFFVALSFLASCEEETKTTQVTNTNIPTTPQPSGSKNPAWGNIIAQHTQGVVSKNATIRIIFSQDAINKDNIGKNANSILSLSPSVKGKAIYESTREIIFIAEKNFTSGQHYTATLQPNNIAGMSSTAAPFNFNFGIVPLEYEVNILSLNQSSNDASRMNIEGELLASDSLHADQVKKTLLAKVQDKALKIAWTHSNNNKKHHFVIKGIVREKFATDVKLTWNGKPIGVDTQGAQEITIPALHMFNILATEIVKDEKDKAYIRISFSDEINTYQNLKGLVQINKNGDDNEQKTTISIESNTIKVYLKDGAVGKYTVTLNQGISSTHNKSLNKRSKYNVEFGKTNPAVRFTSTGSIMPDNSKGTLEIPFEAVGVNAIDVTAFLINPNNIQQFLQINTLSGDNQLGRVGRYLWHKKIPLNPASPNQWNRYSFNASELVKAHPNGLFRLEVSIKRQYSTHDCPSGTQAPDSPIPLLKNHEDNHLTQASGWDGIEQYAQEDNYNSGWKHRHNPCSSAYYAHQDERTKDSQNVIASNIGLLAKRDAHNTLRIITTSLDQANELANVDLSILNFQGQELAKTQSDGKGFATVKLNATPFLLIAKKGNDTAYLKLNSKTALSISHFDVGGEKIQKGLKGYLYGERGVWRPGDDIFLTFVVQDKNNALPKDHPVTLQLFDPEDKLKQTVSSKKSVGGFYAFKLKTAENDPTGKWLVKAHLGGSTFTKSLTIETVRPNRLKVELDFTTEALHGYEPLPTATLFSQWLHGASASNLKTDVSVRFREKTTQFTQFADYRFDDPARKLDSSDQKLLEGRLDEQGKLSFDKNFKPKSLPAGMLSAWFTTRVFEQGGAFSISKQFMDYHHFRNYVGIKVPKGDATRNMLLTDQKHTLNIASLSAKGEPVSLDHVQVTLYKVDWKWWWDKSADSLTEYANATHKSKLQQSIVNTTNGTGTWDFQINYPDWGRYLIRACDLAGKHCTGQTVYVDWPGWAGRAQEQGSGAASRLQLFTDKKQYTVGEIATLQLPKASKGRALLTIETGSDILQQEWVEFNAERTQIKLPITPQMAPNAYINISLLQPHQDKNNDRPIRLYGIIPITVKDPKTHLKPIIEAKAEWRPQSKQTITIKESEGKAMSYTLAIVDEGLLGLTRFKTPDLHRQFYRREALGIQTWDLFDDVIGAYGTKLERLLAIGGGDDVQIDDDANRTKRFPPIVKFLGSFQLKAGETKQHEVTLAPYIGAVRIMLVAGDSTAYGKAEKSIFVKQPLIMQASLPRILSTHEEIVIPVTLFSTQESIKTVTLNLNTDDKITVIGDATSYIPFEKTGDKLAYIRIKTGSKTGKAHLSFSATSDVHSSSSEVFIDIRQPNKETARLSTKVLEAGEQWEASLEAYGLPNTSHAVLELSSIPAMNLEKHMDYLLRYPHGCLEQTISSAFPQLYLPTLLTLDKEKYNAVQHHVESAIDKMRGFQNADGDFTYWPNGSDINHWSSLYAGHFLIEAKNKGYLVPTGLLTRWIKQQARQAQNWLTGSNNHSHIQAYRLYVLAQAGQPEMGAMNRLRESKQLNTQAKWLLAAAYQKLGQTEAATLLTQGMIPNGEGTRAGDTPNDQQHNETFSSTLSDLGLQLETLNTLGKKQDADLFVKRIADELAKDNHNTHGIAWSLMAVSRYLGSQAAHFQASYALNGGDETIINSKTHVNQQALGYFEASQAVIVKNNSKGKLFATLINKGTPKAGDEQALENGLQVKVNYYSLKDKKATDIADISTLPAGKDMAVYIRVTNTSERDLNNIALSYLLPTGWEIHNPSYNLHQGKKEKAAKNSNSKVEHKDIRDDRIYAYMKLKQGQSKEFTILVNPVYKGRYYLPAITAESMYETTLIGRTKGQWIEVTDQKALPAASPKPKIESSTNKPKQLTITAKKAWFHKDPVEASKTKLYVIAGDSVTLLEQEGDWLKIRFTNKNQIFERWIKQSTTNWKDK